MCIRDSSCGVCHVDQLFGQNVMGLGNRYPRANSAFALVQKFFDRLDPQYLKYTTKTQPAEIELMKKNAQLLGWVGQREPAVLGLDTSLAQVALSLAKRESDDWASMTPRSKQAPRKNALSHFVADSKPAVWWTLKLSLIHI